MTSKIKSYIYAVLRKSERFTKTDNVYLAHGGFWTMFGQVITSILTFALLIAFANLLPKETYGTYRYILSIIGILGIFTLGEMNQAITQAVASGDEGSLRTSVRYQLKWNLLMTTALWVISSYHFFTGNVEFALIFAVMGIFIPSTSAFNTFGAYLSGKKEFRLNNVFSVFSTAIYVVGMLLVVWLSGDIFWILIAYTLLTFGTTFLFYYITLKKFNPPESSTGDAIKYGRELTFIGFMSPVVSQIDKIILNHFWGPVQLAAYSLATAIPDRAIPLLKDWVDIAFPKLATRNVSEINKVFYLRIAQGLLVGALVTIAYCIIAPYIFKFLIPQYMDSVFYSQLLSINAIFALPNRYLSILFASKKLTKIIFANTVVNSLVKLVLYVVCGIFGGILGLVIAQIMWNGIGFLISLGMWKLKGQHVLLSTDNQSAIVTRQ